MASLELKTQYFEHTLTLSPNSFPANLSIPLKLAYATFGSPSSPAIMLPTCYGGKLASTTPFLYNPAKAPSNSIPPFPPSEYFIIVVGLIGGGETSSPSNMTSKYAGHNFPKTTYADNINLQKALADHLGVKKLHLYLGFSMGGQQAYHMASKHPAFVENVACLAGSARTSWHNWSFLEGPKAALTNSIDFHDGKYTSPAKRGTGAFGRVYSTWALSQQWFREECWKMAEAGSFDTLEEYLKKNWEEGLGEWDANDLLQLLWTWQKGDICDYNEGGLGGLEEALQRIEAKTLVMPSRTDTYFPPEDNEEELKSLKSGSYVCIESIWGHLAGGGGGTEADTKFIMEEVGKWITKTS